MSILEPKHSIRNTKFGDLGQRPLDKFCEILGRAVSKKFHVCVHDIVAMVETVAMVEAVATVSTMIVTSRDCGHGRDLFSWLKQRSSR